MFKRIKKGLQTNAADRDKADSVLVTFVLSAPLIAALIGFSIDMAKSEYLSGVYVMQAQSAVEASVKTIDARGGLGDKSILAFKKEFEKQSGGGIEAAQTNENKAFESKICNTLEINGVERKLPYYEVKLSTARGKNGVSSETIKIINGQPASQLKQPFKKYQVISADVYTSSSNTLLGMFGMPCQTHKSSVSGIAFGSNQDLK